MRALSLTQPWCGLVSAGIKPDENRGRRIVKREDFGKPFALHATRELDERTYTRLDEIDPSLNARALWSVVQDERARRIRHEDVTPTILPEWMRLSLITSAVIGVATIERCAVIYDEWLWDIQTKERICLAGERRWAFGVYVYMLRDIRALSEPVTTRGDRGFWTLHPQIEDRVLAHL